MSLKGIIFPIFLLCAIFSCRAAENETECDTAMVKSDFIIADTARLALSPGVIEPRISLTDSISETRNHTYAENNWWYLFRKRRLEITDPYVVWPNKFVAWCIGVYNWFNRTFNYHDPAYVAREKRLWKVMLISDNWVDAYSFSPREIPHIRMMGDMYANLGAYVKYYAVSVGYSVDMNTVFGGKATKHTKFDFGIGAARFNIEAHLWRNSGGTYVRTFGDYNNGRLIKKEFDGLTFSALNVHAYYIFNSDKFSWGATYSYGGNQLLSAGTPLLGFDISSYIVDFDFTKLPQELKDYYIYPYDYYRFHYQSYNIIGGYSFNWVMNKHFTGNITVIPGIGISSSVSDSSHGRDILLSASGKGMASLLYTNKRLFIGAKATLNGNALFAGGVDFYSVIQNYQLSIGLKF